MRINYLDRNNHIYQGHKNITWQAYIDKFEEKNERIFRAKKDGLYDKKKITM